jgi:uncharacterized protein (DUF1330 family)
MQAIYAQATPPVFLIFDTEIKDQASYQPFLQTAVKEIQDQGGKFLVRGAKPEILSGPPTPNIMSVSQWNNKESVKRWFNSEAMKPVRGSTGKIYCHAALDCGRRSALKHLRSAESL